MGHIDRTVLHLDPGLRFPGCFQPTAASRAALIGKVVAVACSLGGSCPASLMNGLLTRIAEAAGSDHDDGQACARNAARLARYLVEHAIPLFALSESDLILGSETALVQLRAINVGMSRLSGLVDTLHADARLSDFAPSDDRPAGWIPIDLGEARVLRGVMSSARTRRHIQS